MNPTPTREEFLFIGEAGKHLFYALTYLSLAIAALQIFQRVRLWRKGRSTQEVVRGTTITRWAGNVWVYILGQKKVQTGRPRSGAPMHMALFYGFLTLFIGTTLLAINTYGPWNFHRGVYYLVYEMTLDVMGAVFLVGVTWAFGRRFLYNLRTTRRILGHQPGDYWALGLLLVIGLTGFWLEAARMSVNPQPFDWSGPIGLAWAHLQGPVSPATYRFVWWFHMVWVWAFFALLPQMKLRHIVLAIASAAGKPDSPMGRLTPVTLDEVETTGKIGAEVAADYSRWHLLSLDACMSCGRCTEVCPAWLAGKVLNPQQVVQDIRGAMETGDPVAAKVTEEALWSCTTCNACVEACPVLIRHVDLIVDARRNLVSEGKLAGSAASMLRQVGSTGHAWGVQPGDREAWMQGLDVPLCRDGKPFEYLLWVGCAGATDPGAVRTTRAVAELLLHAGVSFACLGQEEACTGDPARRVGDEFLFQDRATANVAVFEKYATSKVVTACPHCFNSLKNEYGDFGASLDVVHHSQLLAQLVDAGRLRAATPEFGSVTYHDPCYLARVNNESDAPRLVLGDESDLNRGAVPAIAWLEENPDARRNLAEPADHGRKTLCCGAGGGRMWMDDTPDTRPATKRIAQLRSTGAHTVATGCPFCRIMLEPGLNPPGATEMRLLDIAEMLQESNRP
ncbi:MAG: heterodisulfide reductase-related iron-sulfur binding cluster [Fimbriimonadaceae bacterium]